MKTIVKLAGFVSAISFFIFVWLSHTGTLPGSAWGHFWGGVGFLALGVLGTILLANTRAKLSLLLLGLISIANAPAYILLRSAKLIGPVLTGNRPDDIFVAVAAVGLGILYIAIAGLLTTILNDIYEGRI